MGNGYTIRCRKCSYEYQAMLGFGMLFPTVYENSVKAIREGKLGEDYRKFFEEHKDAAVNCEACAAVCTGCGKFATVPDYGLYLPKKETGGTGFGCVMAEDLKKDYRQVMKYDHKCSACGGELKVIDLLDELSENALKCPECGGEMYLTEDLLMWD